MPPTAVSGAPQATAAARSRKARDGPVGVKGPGGGTSPGRSPLSQMPVKSGLPSRVRGAAASMSTRPSALRGAVAERAAGH